MRKNDLISVKELDNKSLLGKINSVKEEISDLILDKNMNKLKDLKVISKKKKDLAQMLTILRQKQLLEQLESKVKEAK